MPSHRPRLVPCRSRYLELSNRPSPSGCTSMAMAVAASRGRIYPLGVAAPGRWDRPRHGHRSCLHCLCEFRCWLISMNSLCCDVIFGYLTARDYRINTWIIPSVCSSVMLTISLEMQFTSAGRQHLFRMFYEIFGSSKSLVLMTLFSLDLSLFSMVGRSLLCHSGSFVLYSLVSHQ
jgi:hypothetical protein